MTARVVRLLAAPLVIFASFCLINSHYGYWPTVGTVLGRPFVGQVSPRLLHLEIRHARLARTIRVPTGSFGALRVPGSSPAFHAATVYLWLPPNFDHVPHDNLPVLFMLSGWPGTPEDWVRAGGALLVANRWAAAHHGEAPVMVFVDENGASGYDTECVNGPQGNAQTYLTRTLPNYLEHHLGLTPAPNRWAVVGFSEGGTCAVGLGTDTPQLFGRFLDLEGDLAPNYGFHQPIRVTLAQLYGGNLAAMRAHDPLNLLATHHYPTSIGWFGAGLQDHQHLAIAKQLAAAAADSGMQTHLLITPGGHTWTFAAGAFARIYPTLIHSMTPQPPAWRPDAARFMRQ